MRRVVQKTTITTYASIDFTRTLTRQFVSRIIQLDIAAAGRALLDPFKHESSQLH